VLPYFKKSEFNKQEWLFELTGYNYHNDKGPLSIDGFNSIEIMKTIVGESLYEMGYFEHMDLNAEEIIGFANAQGTILNGERHSTAKAFLAPFKDRENLHIIKHGLVTSLIIEDNQVMGVNFEVNGEKLQAKAKKETILSAGAVHSPKILMHSGIGKKCDLEKIGIKVVKDLPVGYNLQDHVYASYNLKFHKSRANDHTNKEVSDNLFSFLKHRVGKLVGTGCSDLVAFVNTFDKESKDPNIQYMHVCQPKKFYGYSNFMNKLGFKESFRKTFIDANNEAHTAQVFSTLLKPKSRGNVKLRSTDFNDAPVINSGYLEEEEDLNTLLSGVKLYRKMLKTENFKNHEVEEVKFDIPECDIHDYESDDYWKCFISYFSTTLYHPVGTAKMGDDSDADRVVDSDLKVIGIKGLRVIDASIIPQIVSANTNAAVIMIGEKGSDLIKSEWTTVTEKEI
jgi:choline dehydrogenase